MPIFMYQFMYQFKYTPSVWAGFIKKPDDRGAVVDKLLKGIWRVFLTISPDYSDAIPDFLALS